MEIVVVSDTNILIDLVKLNLLGAFFDLPWEIHTTDFVLSELTDPKQKGDVMSFVNQGKMTIGTLTAEEVAEIFARSEETGGNISYIDYSVCLYARKNKYMLLTGDKKLKDVASAESLEVHGIIYLFDKMVSHSIIQPKLAATKLKELKSFNSWLPINEIDTRIKKWE